MKVRKATVTGPRRRYQVGVGAVVCGAILGLTACKSQAPAGSATKVLTAEALLLALHDDGDFVTLLECRNAPVSRDNCAKSLRVLPMASGCVEASRCPPEKSGGFYDRWRTLDPGHSPGDFEGRLRRLDEDLRVLAEDQAKVAAEPGLDGKMIAEVRAKIAAKTKALQDEKAAALKTRDEVAAVVAALRSGEFTAGADAKVGMYYFQIFDAILGVSRSMTKPQVKAIESLVPKAEEAAGAIRTKRAILADAERRHSTLSRTLDEEAGKVKDFEDKIRAGKCKDGYASWVPFVGKDARCGEYLAGLEEAVTQEGAQRRKVKASAETCATIRSDLSTLEDQLHVLNQKLSPMLGVDLDESVVPPRIVRVHRNSPAEKGGLKPGNAIAFVNSWPIREAADIRAAMQYVIAAPDVVVTISESPGGEQRGIRIPLE